MYCNFDKSLRFKTEAKHPASPRVALVEVNSEGIEEDNEYIPWRKRCHFIGIGLDYRSDIDRFSGENKKEQSICVSLQPIDMRRGGSIPTRYSFFGTNRKVKNFSLRITVGKREKLTGEGCPSFIFENEFFVDETLEDSVEFSLDVDIKTFGELKKQILEENLTDIIFSAGNIPGFYSEWSPTIHTHEIKIWDPEGPDLSIEKKHTNEFKRFSPKHQIDDYRLRLRKELLLTDGQALMSNANAETEA